VPLGFQGVFTQARARKMSKNYQTLLKTLGIVALAALLVAATLQLSGNKTNAKIALGVSASVSGIALLMYGLRP
jgi:hypothetical protein